MNTITARTLDVPGARLHYEVRGSGPFLASMPGAHRLETPVFETAELPAASGPRVIVPAAP
jgi:hypothetical protein